MTLDQTSITALIKSATVPQDPDAAFALFTDDIAKWWPLITHSVGHEDATGLTFGRGVGAEIIEEYGDVQRTSWGTITAWEPPRRVAFTWHPGTPVDEATAVEVTFAPTATGTTVTLTHTGWEDRPDGARMRIGYDTGWDLVLGKYLALTGGQSLT